jgi:hypothetical protein
LRITDYMAQYKGMTIVKKLWIAIGILALLSPLGVILPRWLGAEGAWGEWSADEIERLSGFIPDGMKRLTDLWKAPLPDYTVPGQGRGLLGESVGYLLTGLIGIALTAGAMYVLAKMLTRKNKTGRSNER